MKRWDEVVFVGNLCTQLHTMHAELAKYIKAQRLHLLEDGKTQTAGQMAHMQTYLDTMQTYTGLIYDGVSGKFPLTGVAPWMLDGQPDNLRHRFEGGISLEYVVQQCLSAIYQTCGALRDAGANSDELQKMLMATTAVSICCSKRRLPDHVYMELVKADIIPNLGETEAMQAIHKRCYDEGYAAAAAEHQAQAEAAEAALAAAKDKVRDAAARKKAVAAAKKRKGKK
ncbi:MAG: hypothetical protein EOO38_06440 [Cytophagaceae bacterium]|nr:MAG: hypothetical protein EOO38_06440 [Cytophagaceae bacterium]